jgi:hypothetical protein
MFTHAQAVSDRGTAANSASAPHTTANAYRFAASYSGAAAIGPRQL